MTQQELAMEAGKLRLRLRMNSRLKLESQALLSRLFREHEVVVSDELLSRLVFAVPHELMAESEGAGPMKVKIPPSHPRKPHDDDVTTPPSHPGKPHRDDDMTPPSHPPKRADAWDDEDDDDDDDRPPSRPPRVARGYGDVNKPPSKPPTKR